MSVNLSAYVEKKNAETGKWELVGSSPVSTRLKYIIDDYDELPRVEWDNLSDGMKSRYAKDENGVVYGSFYVTTIEGLESKVDSMISSTYPKVNMIVKALGCQRMFSDDGEELDLCGDSTDGNDRLTFPINRELVDDFQYALDSIRKVGHREALDLILNEYVEDYNGEYRIILVLS